MHWRKTPPPDIFRCCSTEEKLIDVANAIISTIFNIRLRNENPASSVIPPHGSKTSLVKFFDVADASNGNKPPQQ